MSLNKDIDNILVKFFNNEKIEILLNDIDQLYIHYPFEAIPAYIYKLQIDLLNSIDKFDKWLKTLNFIKPLFNYENVISKTYKKTDAIQVFNIIWLNTTYLKTLFILEQDKLFIASTNNLYKLIRKYSQSFAWIIDNNAILLLNADIEYIKCIETIFNISNLTEISKEEKQNAINKLLTDIFWTIYPLKIYNKIEERYSILMIKIISDLFFDKDISKVSEVYNHISSVNNINTDIPKHIQYLTYNQ